MTSRVASLKMELNLYQFFKFIHVGCAVVSICGFTLRGLVLIKTGQKGEGVLFRIAPHIIDTVLLATAIILVVMSQQYPLVTPWVTAKVVALLVYIGLGIANIDA